MDQQDVQNEGGQKNIGMAAICYLGILVIIPLVTDAKHDPYVKFHIKQGLVLLIAGVITFVISMVPILGWIIGFLLWIGILVLAVIGLINAVTGKMQELPLLGKYSDRIDI